MTVNELLLEMDAERNRKEAEAQKKKDDFLAQNPEFSALTAQKNELLLEMLKSRLDSKSGKDFAAETEEINRRIKGVLGSVRESDFEPARNCAICGDTGYVIVNGKKQMCPCLLDKIYTRIYGGADIDALEGSFEKYDLNVFEDAEQKKYMSGAYNFSKNICTNCPMDFLAVLGKSGLGKTFILSCMAKEFKARGKSVLFIGAFQLFDIFHRRRLGEDILIQPIFDADALFIDDLGTEPMTANVTKEYLFRLLCERSAAHRLTAISANLTMNEIKERYTEKISSRIFSGTDGQVLRLEGRDIRMSRR